MNDQPTDVRALRDVAYALLRRDPDARDAHLRLYEIEQMLGQTTAALAHLRAALRSSRLVTLPAHGTAPAVNVLALTRVALWEANIPLELVIDEQRITLNRLFIFDDDDEERLLQTALPPYDVLFNTIAESEQAQPALALADRFAARLGRACLNRPADVATLSRDGVAQRFADSQSVGAPRAERRHPGDLLASQLTAPVLVRPLGSQAGVDLQRADDSAALRAYLAGRTDPAYFVTPFVDYRSPDGFYRKYRVIFIAGIPYPCHLAISPRWMIHYYNAPMSENAWMRDEEAAFLADIGSVFGGGLGAALAEIAAAIPLEYFGIDCGIAPDGRLLLFEADASMLVHGTDPLPLFAYKRPAFERIQRALTEAIAYAAGVRPW